MPGAIRIKNSQSITQYFEFIQKGTKLKIITIKSRWYEGKRGKELIESQKRLAPSFRILGELFTTWKSCSEKYGISISTLIARYKTGLRGKDLIASSWRNRQFRNTTKAGYVYISSPELRKIGIKRMFEHHYVWNQHNPKNPVKPGMQIHHKNGIRDDNRIENLEPKTGPHGSGILLSDGIKYARAYLKEHKPELLK